MRQWPTAIMSSTNCNLRPRLAATPDYPTVELKQDIVLLIVDFDASNEKNILPFFFAGSSQLVYMLLVMFFLPVCWAVWTHALQRQSPCWRCQWIMTVVVNNCCETVVRFNLICCWRLSLTVCCAILMLAEDKRSKLRSWCMQAAVSEELSDLFSRKNIQKAIKIYVQIRACTLYCSAVSTGQH